MKFRRLGLALAASLVMCANSHATIIIPTNQNGADTEVRPEEIAVDALSGLVTATTNRGGSTELATRGNDVGVSPTFNNSEHAQIMYMRFDISGLPNHTSNPSFWSNKNVYFKGTVRNTNINDSRVGFPQPPAGLPTQAATFGIRGLEPGTNRGYIDDGGSTSRTDRSGNSYTSAQYKYNWSEDTGTGTANVGVNTGINGLDAPGLTPFCTDTANCNTSTYGGTSSNPFQGLGRFDDFNSDARFLGNWTWPQPRNTFPSPANRYPVGQPLEYTDSNGNLKQLLFDAQDAGRSSITLMVYFNLNTLNNATINPYSSSFLNFNYLFNPKEMTTMTNDASWYDPDGAGPLPAVPSPYSCNGSTSPGTTTCPGSVLTNNNASGAFSPQLIIRVPEPATITLGVIGLLATLGIARRRRG